MVLNSYVFFRKTEKSNTRLSENITLFSSIKDNAECSINLEDYLDGF